MCMVQITVGMGLLTSSCTRAGHISLAPITAVLLPEPQPLLVFRPHQSVPLLRYSCKQAPAETVCKAHLPGKFLGPLSAIEISADRHFFTLAACFEQVVCRRSLVLSGAC
jgi:hypothetical protein